MAIDIAVAGGSLSVEMVGQGRPALLMLHGWTLDRRMWRPQVMGLSGSSTLLLPDRRGFGRSSAPPGLAWEPDDIPTLLDNFGLEAAILVAHSQAGRVALHAAARHSDRVAGLVLLAAPHDGEPPDPVQEPALPMARLAELVKNGDLPAARALWRSHPMLQVPDEPTARMLDEVLGDYEGRDLLVAPQPLPVDDGLLEKVTCPVRVIVGEADAPSRIRAATRFARYLRDARLIVLPQAGHMANVSHAAAFNRIIREFAAMP